MRRVCGTAQEGAGLGWCPWWTAWDQQAGGGRRHGRGPSRDGGLEVVGSRWWARGGMGREMAWVRPVLRWRDRGGGLEAVWGGRWHGQRPPRDSRLERAGSRWWARGGTGQEMAWARPGLRQQDQGGGLKVAWGGRRRGQRLPRDGHLERAGSRWWARGGVGLETEWARPISRRWARPVSRR